MRKPSKRLRAALAKQPSEPQSLSAAVGTLKQFDKPKFDQTVEVHMRLGVDPNQADQIIRGSVVLPHGIGKTQRIVVFAVVTQPPRLPKPVQTKWVRTTWLKRSKRAGRISTSVLRRRT